MAGNCKDLGSHGQKRIGTKWKGSPTRPTELGRKRPKANNQITKLPGKDEAKGYATLNELATITYLKGEALYKKGDRDGAPAAYYTLIADFNYGQCWDKAGWWWQPAFAARDRIAELTPAQTEVSIDADPLPANLALDGKKGICFTLRKSNQSGSVEENLPKIQATAPTGIILGGWNSSRNNPEDGIHAYGLGSLGHGRFRSIRPQAHRSPDSVRRDQTRTRFQ